MTVLNEEKNKDNSLIAKKSENKYGNGTVAQLLEQKKSNHQLLSSSDHHYKESERKIVNIASEKQSIKPELKNGESIKGVQNLSLKDFERKPKQGLVNLSVESLIKSSLEKSSVKDSIKSSNNDDVNGKVNETGGNIVGSNSANSSDLSDGNQPVFEQVPKLPDNLPSQLTRLLSLLKETRLSHASGKQRFFDENVNKILLEVEKKCLELPRNLRHQVYANLSSYLPCTKDTLMKRAKKLVKEYEEKKVRSFKPKLMITNKPITVPNNSNSNNANVSPQSSTIPPKAHSIFHHSTNWNLFHHQYPYQTLCACAECTRLPRYQSNF